MGEFIVDLFPLSVLFNRSDSLLDVVVVQDLCGEFTQVTHGSQGFERVPLRVPMRMFEKLFAVQTGK